MLSKAAHKAFEQETDDGRIDAGERHAHAGAHPQCIPAIGRGPSAGYGLAFVCRVMGLPFGAQLLGFEGAYQMKRPASLPACSRVLVEPDADHPRPNCSGGDVCGLAVAC